MVSVWPITLMSNAPRSRRVRKTSASNRVWSQFFRIIFEIEDKACGRGRLRRQSLPEDPFDLRFLKSRRRARRIVGTPNCGGMVGLVYHLSARPVGYGDVANLALWIRNQEEHALLGSGGWW